MTQPSSVVSRVESWKPIPGWVGIYSVSDHGRVRSEARTISRSDGNTQRRNARLRSLGVDNSGHLAVILRAQNRPRKSYLVHRLVMAAFVGPCPEGMEVCHNNGDAADNRVENLRYGTRADNAADCVLHGRHPEAEKTHCPRGHGLADPNLMPSQVKRGFRSCLACSRTHQYVRYHAELKDHFQSISDDYYRSIVSTNRS